ncbi:oxidoreductase domain-containing protein [Halogeometricum pallidum JCM 14848]|uniref:Oxidoreductase domain-containing protein n=1 Tax=Halogeometricum pallidum JCM 14848 TaxID=1227487 RepID=M0DLU5_HALPD|nr:Gfo/Idh/MocA family oxidoreductase [Halogeometricum pallidum]ELZ35114.1 oxidoreductase domain-containing protein [Halogeometricum pallidum JCM 14848]
MYNAAVVGCGVVGGRLAESFAEHEETAVWGVCDLVASKAESFASEYDCRAFTDYREMVRADKVDIVYVGVPPAAHREIVEFALDCDRHVICEKPIAEDAAEGAAMVELEAETDRTTAVNLPFRYTPGFGAMRERVAAGEAGTPRRVTLNFRFPQWPREWQDASWLRSREQGGPVREVGTHFLFAVHELFGPIDRVSTEVTYSGPDAYEDSVVGYFSVDGRDGERLDGTIDLLCDCEGEEENSITVVGAESAFSLVEWYRLVENRGRDDERTLNETRASTTLRLVDEFVSALNGEDADLVTFAEATRVQEVVDAVFASEGETVELGTA